jgi:Glycoside hydrolase family 44
MDAADPNRPEAGSGVKGGKEVTPGAPTRTSVEAPPSFVQRWVETIRKADQAHGTRSVHEYILDNEPNLWSTNHRDVHPEPLSYDELLRRTIDYGGAIRAADHDAVIAGPAEWGWSGYLYSAKDLAAGGTNLRPDRRAHGDVPLLAWYLKKLREEQQRTGTRILDVLDVHFYPQGKDVYSPLGGKALDALRIRSTRGLWDATYVDESWIGEPIKLIPRLKAWIAENYPGVGISIGEWNFGGEMRMSGGLATAETLGRFGQLEVTSAYFWVHPPPGSPAYWAFRAYRNFDGKGGRFQDFSLPTATGTGTSLFASRDEHGTRYVFIALNTMADAVAHTTIETPGCGHPTKREAYQFTGAVTGFGPPTTLPNDGAIALDLPPTSITVIDVHASP